MTDAQAPRPDLEALMAQRDSLRHLARGLVLDEHRAEDIVHDAWVAALEKPPEPRAPLRAWLWLYRLPESHRAGHRLPPLRHR